MTIQDGEWERRLKNGPFRDGGLRPELRAQVRTRVLNRPDSGRERAWTRARMTAAAVGFALLIGIGAVYAANQPATWGGGERPTAADGGEGAGPGRDDDPNALHAAPPEQPDGTADTDDADAEAIERKIRGLMRELNEIESNKRREPNVGQDEPVELRVLQNLSGDFMRRYGGYFEATHPNIDVQAKRPIRSDGSYQTFTLDEMRTYIREEKPDLVTLTLGQYAALAEEGLLLPLDEWAARDGFGRTAYFPAVMDVLEETGGGKLYGLAEEFFASLVYVNESLFQEAGIPIPGQDGTLDWDELFETGAALQEAGYPGLIVGYPGSSPSTLAQLIGRSRGLSYLDPVTGEPAVDTAAWRSVWRTVVDRIQTGAVYYGMPVRINDEAYDPDMAPPPSPLVRGKGALYYGNAMSLKDAVTEERFGDWRPLPAPGDGRQEIWISEVYAIPANAAHPEAAWELMKLAAGDGNKNEPESPAWNRRLYAHLDKAERVIGQEPVEALLAMEVDAAAAVREARMMTDDAGFRVYAAYLTYSDRMMEQLLQRASLTVEDALSRLQRELDRAAVRER